jgi:hypothetical protein
VRKSEAKTTHAMSNRSSHPADHANVTNSDVNSTGNVSGLNESFADQARRRRSEERETPGSWRESWGVNPNGENPTGVRPTGCNPYGNNMSGVNPIGINPFGSRPYRRLDTRRGSAPMGEDGQPCD